MKRSVITGRDDVFGPWICERLPLSPRWYTGMGVTIGLVDTERKPIACCMYENYNGASMIGHVVGEGKWTDPKFLWYCFHYAFNEIKVHKLIGPIESENSRSARFFEHLGFTLEATLKACSPQGDILLYTMTKENCRWLQVEESSYGLRQDSFNTRESCSR